MPSWKIIYYESEGGECPTEDFIQSRRTSNRTKIMSLFAILEEKGPTLPRPYADLLEDGIHELRLKLSGDQVRVLYFFCYKDFIIFTHAFIKNTDKVPKKEINRAKKLRDDFLSRYTESRLRKEYNENI